MFYDRFKYMCKQKGVSCNKAVLEIGLSNALPTKWKKTGATPGGDTLNRIAAYFNVSVDYLLGNESDLPDVSNCGDDTSSCDSSFSLSPDEIHLLSLYRSLSQQGKDYVLQTLDLAARVYIKQVNSSNLEEHIG